MWQEGYAVNVKKLDVKHPPANPSYDQQHTKVAQKGNIEKKEICPGFYIN